MCLKSHNVTTAVRLRLYVNGSTNESPIYPPTCPMPGRAERAAAIPTSSTFHASRWVVTHPGAGWPRRQAPYCSTTRGRGERGGGGRGVRGCGCVCYVMSCRGWVNIIEYEACMHHQHYPRRVCLSGSIFVRSVCLSGWCTCSTKEPALADTSAVMFCTSSWVASMTATVYFPERTGAKEAL